VMEAKILACWSKMDYFAECSSDTGGDEDYRR
jgi:hypothetical protein